MFKLSERSKERLSGVDPRLINIVNLALTISKIDFGIPADGGLRTEDQQHALFLKGASKCDGIKSRSNHQDGLAVDFYAYVDGKASWDHLHLTHVAAALLQAASQLGYKIRWGGFFGANGWDKPHIEIVE